MFWELFALSEDCGYTTKMQNDAGTCTYYGTFLTR